MKKTYWNITFVHYVNNILTYSHRVVSTTDPFITSKDYDQFFETYGRDIVILSISNIGEMTEEEWEGGDNEP